MRSDDEIERLCDRVLNGEQHTQALSVTLREFQKFYVSITRTLGTLPVVSLVNLETLVKAQFSDVSPQHFDVSETHPLTPNDFDFILSKKWYGSKSPPQSLAAFLVGEAKQNWKPLTPILFLSVGLLAFLNDGQLYELLATLLIQSSTVFLSVYLIFTVGQSHLLQNDVRLFKAGTLQHYWRDDRNVTALGILTVGLTFLAVGVAALAGKCLAGSNAAELRVVGRLLSSVCYGVAVTALFDTFLIVAKYYLERARDVAERNLASSILHEDLRRLHGPPPSEPAHE